MYGGYVLLPHPFSSTETPCEFWERRNLLRNMSAGALTLFSGSILKARLHMRFLVRFCRTFQCSFCRALIRDENHKCKVSAISMLFVTAVSHRFRTCYRQGTLAVTELHWNRRMVTPAIKVAFKSARNIASKIACVNGP